MTHYRSALRAEAKALLRADPLFADVKCVISSAKLDPDSLPCWSVSTPGEDREDLSSTQFRADTDLVVALSIKGDADTIEDELDAHSEKIELLLIEGLKKNTGVQGVLLRRTETKTGPELLHVTGSVMMLFVVTGFIQDE
ncbi:hypothetical protein [Shimia sp. MIT910701]|uniref:hypothetical protein n=1 Tax=Shimia sp. MIT910701 TaxID=3096987 RepID=UPI00399ACC0A